MLTLQTLGSLLLQSGSGSVLPGRRKALVLLAFLARRSPRAVSRAELATLLWGDQDEPRARHSFRQTISELRAVLPETLEVTPESVRLNPDSLRFDAREFEAAIAEDRMDAAIGMWQGDFLSGCEDLGAEELRVWIDAERAALGTRLAFACRREVERARSAGDWQRALAAADRWCEALPNDEDARAAAVEALRIGGGAAGPVRLGGRGLLTPDLVGRTQALGKLQQGWQAVLEGHRVVAVITGDEGFGKSRLCREFARMVRLEPRGCTIVEARAFAAERNRSWTALRPVLAALADAPGFRAAPTPALARAAEIAPEIRERLPQLPPAARDTSDVDSILRIVTEVAAETPLLLVFDDAVIADPASLEVLSALVRRPPPGCYLVMTSRPADLDSSALALDLRPASANMIRVELGPLDAREIALLLASMMPLAPGAADPIAGQLTRATSGNPGDVERLVFAWVDAGLLAPGPDGGWVLTRALDPAGFPLPSDMRASITARLVRLGPDARAIAEAAAVFEGEIEPDLLERVSAVPGDRFADAIGEVISHRLLRDSARGTRTYEFPSEPTRGAIYDALAPSRRADLLARWRDHAEPGTQPVRSRFRFVLAAGVILGVGIAIWAIARPGPAEVGRGSQILLADVSNRSSDSSLGRAFHTAATVGLQGSRYLSFFPRTRVSETLIRMNRSGADSNLTEQLARDIAVREGLAMVVALGVTQVDSSYLLSARLIDPHTGEDLHVSSVQVAGRAGLLEGMGRVLERTRKALGESSSELRANREPLPRITTSSLEALQEYVAGEGAWARRDAQSAQRHWERAVALDSTFAMALSALALVQYVSYNDRARGDKWMNRALALSERLTERERLRLRSQAAQMQGRDAEAVDYAQTLAERYPTRDTWYNHGTVLMRQYRCREATPSFSRALQFDSMFTNGYLNLATCLQITGPPDSAVAAYAAAGRVDTLALYRANINHEWGVALVRAGHADRAESAYTKMAETGRALDRARGFRSLAWLALYRGQARLAVTHLLEAIKLNQTGQSALSVFRNQLILSHAYLLLGDTVRSRRSLDSAVVTSRQVTLDPALLLYLGQAQLRAGRTSAARGTFARLASGVSLASAYDQAVKQGLESRLLLAEGDVNGALAAARPSHDPRQAAYRLSALALAFGLARQPDSALAAAVQLSNEFSFGTEGQIEWHRGPLLVARFAEAKGDSATARAAYGRLLEQWKAGDPDLPDLIFAREALRRLQPRGR